MASIANKTNKLTDKLVEKIGVQRTPAANPEMYKSDDYSVHLKGHNRTEQQAEREIAEGKEHTQTGGDPAVESSLGFKAT